MGSTVTWRNAGEAPHTVTAEDGSFDSEMIAAGGSWARTFETAGTFAYVCSFHPRDGGRGRGHGLARSPPLAAVGSTAPAAVAPAATQPPPPSEPASEPAAVSTQGPSFGGELMARVAIVGLLIGGAFLLFVRAVGGSVRGRPGRGWEWPDISPG